MVLVLGAVALAPIAVATPDDRHSRIELLGISQDGRRALLLETDQEETSHLSILRVGRKKPEIRWLVGDEYPGAKTVSRAVLEQEPLLPALQQILPGQPLFVEPPATPGELSPGGRFFIRTRMKTEKGAGQRCGTTSYEEQCPRRNHTLVVEFVGPRGVLQRELQTLVSSCCYVTSQAMGYWLGDERVVVLGSADLYCGNHGASQGFVLFVSQPRSLATWPPRKLARALNAEGMHLFDQARRWGGTVGGGNNTWRLTQRWLSLALEQDATYETALYNSACAYAIYGSVQEAVDRLRALRELGTAVAWRKLDQARADPDLKRLCMEEALGDILPAPMEDCDAHPRVPVPGMWIQDPAPE